MLPLWIIDLREKTSRRDIFEDLVGKVDHVYIPPVKAKTIQDEDNASSFESDTDTDESIVLNAAVEIPIERQRVEDVSDSFITGYYWRYSRMEDNFYGISIDGSNGDDIRKRFDGEQVRSEVEEVPTAAGTASRLYKFQSDLVHEGQEFIKNLRKSNAPPDIKFNVVVLGDLTESFTRIVFPSVARMLQKEKGRMLPHHIHQGMEIIGMLYVPADINTRKVAERRSMKRTLTEIDVQHRVNDMRGYDHMMFYQDVQNRTETVYPMLNDRQLAEYLLQCLVHLFLACDETHPLLSGTTAADAFYFSMGATSLHYNAENECINAQNKVAREFIRQLKSQGIDEKRNKDLSLLDESNYAPEKLLSDFEVVEKLNKDIITIKKPNPHPYKQFLARKLNRYYYGHYLKYFSKELMHHIHSKVESGTKSALDEVAVKSKRRFADTQRIIFEGVEGVVGNLSADDGGIPTIEYLFKDLQEKVSRQRPDIKPLLNVMYWRKVEETLIQRNIRDQFEEYHDAYLADMKNKSDGKQQLKIKKDAINELNGHLSQESTLTGIIGRDILFAIMLILAVIPLLCLISPRLINLGNVRRYAEIWAAALFSVPAIISIIKIGRYQLRKKRLINNLKAIYLHDAFARVANRMESEVNSFYDRIIALSGKYIDRCAQIMKELGRGFKDDENKEDLFPETMFNQPLIGGHFGSKQLLPASENEDAEVNINYIRYKLSELSPVEYFLFINQNKNIIKELFCDVRIPENLLRRLDEGGNEVLLTKSQQEQEMLEEWSNHQEQFYRKLKDMVRESVKIYENSTIGEKTLHYYKHNGYSFLKNTIAYAASNGELTSSSDLEYVDAKFNDKRLCEIITPIISPYASQFQPDTEHEIYQQYLFITRWRCFDNLAFNRILPTEDFDMKVYNEVVVTEDTENFDDEDGQVGNGSNEEGNVDNDGNKKPRYSPKPSSLLLWALSLYDSSTEWFRLFDSEVFEQAYADKNVYRKILNIED